MAKKVKEINGIKIINRYTGATFFTGLFCLMASALFILLLFFPLFTLQNDKTIVQSVKGLDVLLYLFQSKKDVFNNIYSAIDAKLNLIYTVINYALGGFIILGLIYSLILIIYGLKIFVFGKVKNYSLGKTVSLLIFLLFVFLSIGLYFYFFFLNKNLNSDPSGVLFNNVNLLYMYIFCGVSAALFILLLIIYLACFYNKIYVSDVSKYDFLNSPKVVYSYTNNGMANAPINGPIYQSYSPTKMRYNVNNLLPASISSIGGHAFSQNVNLKLANIPNNISFIGHSAFSNCPNLEMVNIPVSVKQIGYNCFFNCYSLKRINYAGTKEEWRRIKRGSNWLYKAGTSIVVCKDGPIYVNIYH